jgi:phage virion morphogenesis protein
VAQVEIVVDVPQAILDDTLAIDSMLAELGATAKRQTMERFSSGTDPGGAAWAPTKRGGQILVDTGNLMGSIDFTVGGDQVAIGTNVFYGAFHQHGTSKMVARPFLGFGADDMAEITEIAQRHLAAALGGGA